MRGKRALVAVFVLAATALTSTAEFEQKWIFLRFGQSLGSTAGADRAIQLLEQAHALGIRHALLSDSSHLQAEKAGQDYFANIARVKARAAELKIALIPTVFPTGYGGRYFGFDRMLAAGVPVRNAPFVVRGREAQPDPSAVPALVNGGFEEVSNGAIRGWNAGDAASRVAPDTSVAHEGRASLRLSAGPAAAGGSTATVTLTQNLAITPFRSYLVSFWLRTDGVANGRSTLEAYSDSNRRRHVFRDLTVQPTQDWRQYTVILHGLEAREVRLQLGLRLSAGTAWLDDVRFAPLGLLNVIRRARTPVKVTSADGRTVYEEGRDFERIEDPDFRPNNITRPAPPLRLTAASRIPDGATVLVSWFYPPVILGSQVNLTMNEPKVFELMDYEMQWAARVWDAPGYFMNVDEIRVAGWEEGDAAPGRILADFTRQGVDIIRRRAPGRTIYTWSDMYTPHHNARPFSVSGHYYLVNGNYDDAWATLPKDVVIMMWYSRDPAGVRWFADRGHRQILCGYYDGDLRENISGWMRNSEGVPGVVGMMYTTWENNFDDMKEFFQLVETYPKWPAGK
jgi:hypothetical protein